MNLNYLTYFRTLARLEHYGKAAQELYISQPSLSHAIAALEKELGTKLFEKQGRNVTLTKYGKLYAQSVETALSELDRGEKKLRDLTSSQSGHVDLAFFHTLGITFVPQLVRSFLNTKEHQNVIFSLSQCATSKIIEGLKEGKYDIGFCSYIKNNSDLEMIPVGCQDICVLVSNNHPLASKEKISLKEISDYPFIAFDNSSGLKPVIDDIFASAGVKPNVAFTAEHGSSVAGLVAAEFGISIMPQIPLPDLNVRFVPIVEPVKPRYIYMVIMHNKYLTDAVQEFRNHVLNSTKQPL